MYINTTTQQLQTESEIRAANPNTSYPTPFGTPEGYAYIFPAPQPSYDPVTQRVQSATPELTGLGHWEQRWSVVDFDAEQIAVNQAVKVEADKTAIRAQIKQLESEQLMPRATREFMLLTMEGMATPEQLAANFGYAAVKAFDAQIEALRDQLV